MASATLIRRVAMTVAEPPGEAGRSTHVETTDSAETTRGGPWRAGRDARIAALVPFAVLAAAYLLPYHNSVFVKPPSILGFPSGLVFEATAVLWALVGAVVVWKTSLRFVVALALVVCSATTTVAIALIPVLIPILMTLG